MSPADASKGDQLGSTEPVPMRIVSLLCLFTFLLLGCTPPEEQGDPSYAPAGQVARIKIPDSQMVVVATSLDGYYPQLQNRTPADLKVMVDEGKVLVEMVNTQVRVVAVHDGSNGTNDVREVELLEGDNAGKRGFVHYKWIVLPDK